MHTTPTLELRFSPSPGLAILLVAAHLLAVAVVWVSNLGFTWHLALKIAILTSLVACLAHAGWLALPGRLAGLTAGRITAVRIFASERAMPGSIAGDRIEATRADGLREQGSIAAGSLVTLALATLHYRPDPPLPWWRARVSVVLVPADALSPDDFRQLRVRLKWGVPTV